VNDGGMALDMKPISIFILGFSFAALPGCAATLTPRPLIWQEGQFSATLPCEPEASSSEGTTDHTPYGTLHGLSYACTDKSRPARFVVTLGFFAEPWPPPLNGWKKPDDADIAAKLADTLCLVFKEKESGLYCMPDAPVDKGGFTDVDVAMSIGLHASASRVRVAYPYVVTVAATGKVTQEEMVAALDVKLPKP